MDINDFQTKTNQSLSNSSQLKLFNILEDKDNNGYYLNIFRSYIINDSQLNNSLFYDVYEVGFNEWLDSISYTNYQTSVLWWVIAILNNITNPFEALEPGTSLKILKSSYIYNILKEIKTIGNS